MIDASFPCISQKFMNFGVVLVKRYLVTEACTGLSKSERIEIVLRLLTKIVAKI